MNSRNIFSPAFIFALALTVGLTIFYLPIFTGGNFIAGDLPYYFEPLCNYLGQCLRNGQIPLWNPYCNLGMSQIAIASPGLLYPFNWLFSNFNFSVGVALSMIIHQAIAGAGMFLLIESLAWGTVAALVAGVTFALSGYMFSFVSQFTLVEAVSWIPLALWGMTKITNAFNLRNVSLVYLVSLSIYMLITAGRPEVAAPALAIIFVYLIWLAVRTGTTIDVAATTWRLAALMSAVALAAPAILPALEWLNLSRRAAGLRPEQVLIWSANWYDWLSIVLIQPLGTFQIPGNRFAHFVGLPYGALPFLANAYLGPVAITAASWSAFDTKWRARIPLALLLLFSILLAAGDNTAVMPWLLSNCSALAVLRYPIKLMFLPVLILTIFASRGIFLLFSRQLTKKMLAPGIIWLAIAIFALLYLTVNNSKTSMVQPEQLIAAASLQAALLGLLITFTAGAFLTNRMTKVKTGAVILTTLALSLIFSAHTSATPLASQEFYRTPLLLAQLVKQFSPNNNRLLPLYGLPDILYPWRTPALPTGHAEYTRAMLCPNAQIDAQLVSPFGFEGAETREFDTLWQTVDKCHEDIDSPYYWPKTDHPLKRLSELSSTPLLAGQIYRKSPNSNLSLLPILDPDLFELVHQDWSMNLRLYRTATSTRARFIDNVKTVASHQEALDEIVYADALDDNSTLVEGNLDSSLTLGATNFAKVTKAPTITIDEPGHIRLYTRNSKAQLLTVSDHFYPGWQAFIDGHATKILCTNAVTRSVIVNPGIHNIDFYYRPESLTLGLYLAAFTIFAMVLLLIFSIRQERVV